MIVPLIAVFIFRLNLIESYQHASLTAPSKELSFCLSKPTTSSTVQTFWHDAASECQLEPKRLIDLYTQLREQDVNNADEDRCNLLLIHEMRKSLIAAVSQQLEEAFVTHKTLRENGELTRLLENIHGIDKRISEAVWQRTLDEIHLFVEPKRIVQEILHLKSDEIQVFGLQSLLSKSKSNLQGTQSILPLLTYALSKLSNSKYLPSTSLDRLNMFYQQLPQELRALYSTSEATKVGLLNCGHGEYLYAPRDIGPDSQRRIPLTWTMEKNSIDTDGHFYVEFNATDSIALGCYFGAALKFLYADVEHQAPYFWIGPGTMGSHRWWRVIWPHDSHSTEGERGMALENYQTKEILCATTPYDENRRYVILMKGRDSIHRKNCQWLVKEILT